MKYQNTIHGKFDSRLNRFVAQVWINDRLEAVHVKNTGRCRELLLPSADVVLDRSDNPNRRTKYDLIAVRKEGLGMVNIDSQAPNAVVREWLAGQGYSYIKPEYRYGSSRIDFYMERGADRYLMEVKGCTLEVEGIGYFPDAPTGRGVKHLRELTEAVKKGYRCMIAFVIPMEGVYEVRPNASIHPEFKAALEEAEAAGVEVWFMPCKVGEASLEVVDAIKK